MAGQDDESLSALNDLLALQADASEVAMIAALPYGPLLAHNERFASMWGVPKDVLASGRLTNIALWFLNRGPEEAATVARILAVVEAPRNGEIATSDGRVITWSAASLATGGARVWVFRDVTNARQFASGLRDAGNWLRILEVHVRGIVLELDANASIVGIWGQTADYFEKDDRALQGQPVAAALGGPQGDAFAARVRGVLATSQPSGFEYTLEIRGERRVFDADAALMPSADEELPRVTVFIRDVTERARMQSQLLQSERLASVGLLAAGVAHEINNPIAYTMLNLQRLKGGLAKLARQQPSDGLAGLLEAVTMSLEGTQRVQTIVQDLRRFARSDDPEQGVPVDVRRALDFAIRMAMPEVGERARVVRELFDVPHVVASEVRLSQIFLNLIVNAAQAIPPRARADGREHEIRIVTKTDEARRAVVEVHDTGAGMSPSVMQHLFEPFYTTKAPGIGTGLGLAICHGITTSLGGEITVESEEGRGSVFRVLLPPAE